MTGQSNQTRARIEELAPDVQELTPEQAAEAQGGSVTSVITEGSVYTAKGTVELSDRVDSACF
jgi:hypothetical protein